jgi:DKNYY family
MQFIQKLFGAKMSKMTFFIFLVIVFLQILIASKAIIKPISLSPNLILLHSIMIVEFITFPISLLIVFSYALNKISWLDKKSFLITFAVTCLFLMVTVIFGSQIIPWELYGFFQYLRGLFFFAGIIGLPLIYVLGWSGWNVLGLAIIIGMFVVAFILAFLVSFTTWLAIKKKKPIFRIILITVLSLLIVGGMLQAVNKAYVSKLSGKGECAVWLNFYQCDDYSKLGDRYYRVSDDVYYGSELEKNPIKIDDVDIDSFEIIKKDWLRVVFAKDKYRAYVEGEVIPVQNIDSWKVGQVVYNKGYSSSDENVFFGTSVLEGADPESTDFFNGDYACNNDFVYYEGRIIDGADPNSFVTFDCRGYSKDDKSYYFYGEKTSENQARCEGAWYDEGIIGRCKLD